MYLGGFELDIGYHDARSTLFGKRNGALLPDATTDSVGACQHGKLIATSGCEAEGGGTLPYDPCGFTSTRRGTGPGPFVGGLRNTDRGGCEPGSFGQLAVFQCYVV